MPSRPCLAVALLLTAAGCAPVGPDFAAPRPWWSPPTWLSAPEVPRTQAPSRPVEAPVDPQWWTLLGDPLLTRLEERLVDGNLTLRAAAIRLAQARAQVGVAESEGALQGHANASYTRSQLSKKGTVSLNATTTGAAGQSSSNGLGGRSGVPNSRLLQPYNLFQYGFDLSWELDIWGRVRRIVEQAEAQEDAAGEALRGAMVIAAADLAQNYVRLRGVQRKIEITRQNLGIAQASLRLTRERAAGGVTTDLDVANAAALVADVESQIPELERQRDALVNAMSLLLGAPPQALAAELAAPRAVPPVPPQVPVGVPSDLVRRRPDIREAEASLHAATAATGVAVAEFYPKITLTGSGGIQGVKASNLADWAAQTYAFGPAVTLPIFDGARLRRTLDLRGLQQEEAGLLWQTRLLTALHEVDDALAAYGSEQRRRERLGEAVTQNRRALDLARSRYSLGVADFLQVLTAQRSLLAAEQDLVDSTTAVSANFVQLYRALGGGWD